MGVQMYVSLSVGMWRDNGNPNPYSDFNEILQAHPHLSKEGFGVGLTPLLPHLDLGGLIPFQLKATVLKTFTKQKMLTRMQMNPGSAGYLSYNS